MKNASHVSVVELDFTWLYDVTQVIYGCSEPLVLLKFERDAGSPQDLQNDLYIFLGECWGSRRGSRCMRGRKDAYYSSTGSVTRPRFVET